MNELHTTEPSATIETAATIEIRRIVTGVNAAGESTVASDRTLESGGFPGGSALFVWGHDEAPTVPTNGDEPTWDGSFPPVGGSRISFSHFLPGQAKEYDEFVNSVAPDPIPGMHVSDTVDYAVVISGHLQMELEDGTIVDLGPNDVIVQNGTRHRWVNVGDDAAVLLAISVGAQRI